MQNLLANEKLIELKFLFFIVLIFTNLPLQLGRACQSKPRGGGEYTVIDDLQAESPNC